MRYIMCAPYDNVMIPDMQLSEIVIPNTKDVPAKQHHNVKLREAYISEREQLEMTELELSRAKIMMIDSNGKLIRISLLLEH
ncbi:hypothetical protein VIOR103205_13845 [Vibrio ordalii]